MDLHATPDQQAFRAELRGWLQAKLPWEYGKGLPPRFDDLAEEVAFLRSWQGKLAAGRWVGVAWPEAYGGRGAGPVEHFTVQEELARARAPEMVGRIGINLAGPTLLAHATDEQKLAGCRGSCRPKNCGVSCSVSRGREAIWLPSRPAPLQSRVAGGSTVRRSGRRMRSSLTGGSASLAPSPTHPSTKASRTSWSTCTTRAWTSGR